MIHVRNPLGLTNWTFPVLEAMMVAGAALALWWAIRRLRREGDPTNLVLWLGSVVYLLVTEIPLYFPESFGISDQIGVVFAHNVFTVDFLYDRLPLYIVALYPAVTTLAFEIVRSLGVFRRYSIVVGAVCVGFVHHCCYEVFDHLGPQLRWWTWNTENPINHPLFASVPMTSVVIFAMLGPTVLVFLTMLLVGRHAQAGRTLGVASLAWRTVTAGALVVVGVAVLSIPASLFGGATPNITAQAAVFSCYLVGFALVAIGVLAREWRAQHAAGGTPNTFTRIFGPMYLAVLGLLWLTALPAYFGASGGFTPNGTPTGALWYAAGCFVLAALAVAAGWTTRTDQLTLQNSVEMSRSQ